MAPKTRAGAKAKAAAKSHAASASSASNGRAAGKTKGGAAQSRAASPSNQDSSAAELKRKRRQPQRRDSDAKADRALRKRLAGMDESEWSSHRDKDGMSIREVVKNEQRRRHKQGLKIPVSFWSELGRRFGLQCGDAEDLPDPDESEPEVDVDLKNALALVNSDGIAFNKTAELADYLERQDDMPYQTMYGILRAVQPSLTVSQSVSDSACFEVLKFFGRTPCLSPEPRTPIS